MTGTLRPLAATYFNCRSGRTPAVHAPPPSTPALIESSPKIDDASTGGPPRRHRGPEGAGARAVLGAAREQHEPGAERWPEAAPSLPSNHGPCGSDVRSAAASGDGRAAVGQRLPKPTISIIRMPGTAGPRSTSSASRRPGAAISPLDRCLASLPRAARRLPVAVPGSR